MIYNDKFATEYAIYNDSRDSFSEILARLRNLHTLFVILFFKRLSRPPKGWHKRNVEKVKDPQILQKGVIRATLELSDVCLKASYTILSKKCHDFKVSSNRTL